MEKNKPVAIENMMGYDPHLPYIILYIGGWISENHSREYIAAGITY